MSYGSSLLGQFLSNSPGREKPAFFAILLKITCFICINSLQNPLKFSLALISLTCMVRGAHTYVAEHNAMVGRPEQPSSLTGGNKPLFAHQPCWEHQPRMSKTPMLPPAPDVALWLLSEFLPCQKTLTSWLWWSHAQPPHPEVLRDWQHSPEKCAARMSP